MNRMQEKETLHYQIMGSVYVGVLNMRVNLCKN